MPSLFGYNNNLGDFQQMFRPGNPNWQQVPPQGMFGPPPPQAQGGAGLFGGGGGLFGAPVPPQAGLFAGVAPRPQPHIDIAPSQDLDQSAMDTMDTDSPFSCPVCCNEYSSSDKHKNRRPYNYECGHTTCKGCIEKNTRSTVEGKKCPFCSKFSKNQVRNFSLEQAHDWAKQQLKGGSDESSLYKNQSLCLTCMETFDPSTKLLFGNSHANHEVVPLKDKDPKLMKKIFWVLRFIKNDGTLNMDRAETLITMLMNFADHYLEALFFVQSMIHKSKIDSIKSLQNDIKLFMKNETKLEKYNHKKLLDSLLNIRELEVEKAHSVYNIAKDCQLPLSDLLDDEFFEDLKKDQESYVPLGMDEKYLGMFPLLSSLLHPNQPSKDQSFCQAWFDNWYAARTRTKSC